MTGRCNFQKFSFVVIENYKNEWGRQMLITKFNILRKAGLRKDGLKKYFGDVCTLACGTLLAQLIVVAISPIVTRIYRPEQLGAYTIILTVVGVLGPIINGRYDLTIVTARDERDADILTVSAILISLVFSAAVGIVFLALYTPLQKIFGNMGWWIFITIPLLVISGVTNTLTSYNNRHKQYKLIASVSIIRSSIQAAGQIVFGFLSFGTSGLLVSQVVSSICGLKRQASFAFGNLKRFTTIKKKEIGQVLKDNLNQPLYSTPALLLNTLSYSLINFFISSLYGIRELGFYSLAFRMLVLPVQLVSLNVAQVFFERASEESRVKGNCFNSFRDTSVLLAILTTPVFCLIFLVSEKVFGIIFGAEWARAGTFVALLTPMFAIRFVVTSLTLVLTVNGKQKVEFIWQSVFPILSCFIYVAAKKSLFTIERFLILISIAYAINYLCIFAYINYISRQNVDRAISQHKSQQVKGEPE